MQPGVAVSHLTKDFGPLRAVDDLSFSVGSGEVVGFLGPNGAGKSTTMKMITGFIAPTSGSVRVCGHDVASDPIAAKRCIGYLPEGAPAYGEMTPAGFLDFIADIRELRGAQKEARIREVVGKIHLEHVMNQTIDTLSKGFKRRVGLAQAILHDPEVLVLDEPTDGLDPNQKHEVRALIQAMAKDKTIIVSTHILEEVHAVCNRAIIIARGKVLADDTPAALEARSRFHQAVSLSADNAQAARDVLVRIGDVAAVEIDTQDQRVTAFPRPGKAIFGAVVDALKANGIQVHEIALEQGRLDEVFRQITTTAKEAA